MSTDELTVSLENAKKEIEWLKNQVRELNSEIRGRRYLPSTSLLSDKFLTRAFAVLGHYIVASLIIAVPFYIVIGIIAFLASRF